MALSHRRGREQQPHRAEIAKTPFENEVGRRPQKSSCLIDRRGPRSIVRRGCRSGGAGGSTRRTLSNSYKIPCPPASKTYAPSVNSRPLIRAGPAVKSSQDAFPRTRSGCALNTRDKEHCHVGRRHAGPRLRPVGVGIGYAYACERL